MGFGPASEIPQVKRCRTECSARGPQNGILKLSEFAVDKDELSIDNIRYIREVRRVQLAAESRGRAN